MAMTKSGSHLSSQIFDIQVNASAADLGTQDPGPWASRVGVVVVADDQVDGGTSLEPKLGKHDWEPK